MTRHPDEDTLVLHHYEPEAEVAAHLAACAACRTRAASLGAFLARVSEAGDDVPEPAESYGREVWRRLAPRLAAPRAEARLRRPLLSFLAPPRLALAGGVFALVVAAFVAGRLFQARTGISPAVRERILLVAVGEHLERSEMVLLELLNSEGGAAEQARAEELVSRSRLYRQTALRSGERNVADVLEELERLLLEIARTPAPVPAERREALRRRVEKSGLLFRVRILGTNLESAPPRRSEPTSL
jgi:hypothetical protein